MKDAIFWFVWGVLSLGAMLLALAISDYRAEELQRLERVHTAGMAIGSTMCGGPVQ